MLEIFPSRVLDSSIHTSLLVGILVSWLATETFGFVFAGFVVAGYLAAIAVVRPMSFVAATVEAILTYGVVWIVGAGARRLRLWNLVFGRERFLLFLVFAAPIRLFVEGIAGPHIEPLLRPLQLRPLD